MSHLISAAYLNKTGNKSQSPHTFHDLEIENSHLRRKLFELSSMISLKLQDKANRKPYYEGTHLSVLNSRIKNASKTARILNKDKEFFEKKLEKISDSSYLFKLQSTISEKEGKLHRLEQPESKSVRKSLPKARDTYFSLLQKRNYLLEKIEIIEESALDKKITKAQGDYLNLKRTYKRLRSKLKPKALPNEQFENLKKQHATQQVHYENAIGKLKIKIADLTSELGKVQKLESEIKKKMGRKNNEYSRLNSIASTKSEKRILSKTVTPAINKQAQFVSDNKMRTIKQLKQFLD